MSLHWPIYSGNCFVLAPLDVGAAIGYRNDTALHLNRTHLFCGAAIQTDAILVNALNISISSHDFHLLTR